MLTWALIFFIIALVAAVFGFTGIAAVAAGAARIIFFIFVVLFLIALVFNFRLNQTAGKFSTLLPAITIHVMNPFYRSN